MMGWTSVKERLPKENYSGNGNSMGCHVLCSCVGGYVGRSFYFKGKFIELEEKGYTVVAWMPLPEPYNEE